MLDRFVRAVALAVSLALLSATPSFAGGFDSWAALVVAGDSHAHSGAHSEVFDNARRDITKALEAIGFAGGNILQYSTQPDADKDTNPRLSNRDAVYDGFTKLARQTSGGCFIYFTSHGGQAGILLGNEIVTPHAIAQLVDDACADKTTVVVISACYSGIFVPALASDTRMVLTAARKDRTSFGCGEDNQYTFFDECVLKAMGHAQNFPVLGVEAQDCVAAREKAEGVGPPSEPQMSLGTAVVSALSTGYIFPKTNN